MHESDVKVLEQAGLTHAQSIIYLTLLEIGQTKIGTIIEKTNLQSSVVHNNINKLIEAGLVNFILVGKMKHYHVADPAVFLGFLDKQKEEIDERKKSIAQLLPRLHLLKEYAKKKTMVEVYSGRKGFQTAFMEEYSQLENNQVIPFLALPLEFHHDIELEEIYVKMNRIALQKKCTFQGVGPKGVKKIWERYYPDKGQYQFRYIEEDFPWDVNIFKESVLLSMWGEEPIVIRVASRRFRENALRYFKQKWAQGKK